MWFEIIICQLALSAKLNAHLNE